MSILSVLQGPGDLLLLSVGLISSLLLFYYLKWIRPRNKILEAIPASFPAMPVLGASPYLKDGPEFRLQLLDFCLREHPKEGIAKIWIGMHPVVVVWKAPYVEAILSSREIKKSYLYEFTKPWLGEGLLTSYGQKWFDHRKLLTHSFHFRILQDFVPVMNEHAEDLVGLLEKHCGQGDVDIFPLVTMVTLNVICEAAMGQATDEEDRRMREKVFQAVIDLSHAIQQRQKSPSLWLGLTFPLTKIGRIHDRNWTIIRDYTDKIFKERLASFDRMAVETLMTTDAGVGGKRRPLPFLDSLLYSCDDFSKLSEQDIKDQVNTFLFTGHDTTAASISWTLWLLARHPEAQAKVHEELDSVFGSSNRPVNEDDVKKLRYLTACFKESLRLYPVAPIYGRELVEDLQFGEYLVPAGTSVIVLNEPLHRDPTYFPEPDLFKPERFLTTAGDPDSDEAVSKLHPFAYVPFSAGQRNCIGQRYAQMEDKIVLATILRRLSLESDCTEQSIAPAAEVIMRPTNGIYMRVNYRS